MRNTNVVALQPKQEGKAKRRPRCHRRPEAGDLKHRSAGARRSVLRRLQISGRRTVNSHPIPSPALRASIAPPCISRFFTSVSPMPIRPALGSVVGLHEQFENMREHFRGRCRCRYPDADTTSPHPASPITRCCPFASVYLAEFVNRFPMTWVSRTGSAFTSRDSVGRKASRRCPWASISDCCHLHGSGDHGGDFDRLLPKVDLATHDSRDVEQIVDQANQVMYLPFHHVPRLLQCRSIDPRDLQYLEGVADRGERVAQLVREGREELVLATVGLGQLLTRTRSSSSRRLRP